MALDTNIALGVRPVEQPNMLAQMGQMMQLRGAQQQYEQQNNLRDAFAQGTDINDPATFDRIARQDPKLALELRGKNFDQQQKQTEMGLKRADYLGAAYSGLVKNPTVDNAYSIFDNAVQMGIIPPQAAAAMRAKIAATGGDPRQIAALAQQGIDAATSAQAKLQAEVTREGHGVQMAGHNISRDNSIRTDTRERSKLHFLTGDNGFYGVNQYNATATPVGMAPPPPAAQPPVTNALANPATASTIVNAPVNSLLPTVQSQPGAPTVANAPTTLLRPPAKNIQTTEITDPDNPMQSLRVNANTYTGKGVNDPGYIGVVKTGNLNPVQQQKLKTEMAKDYKIVENAMAQTDEILKSIDAVRNSDLKAISGPVAGRLPTAKDNSLLAETRLDNLKGKVTALGKASSTMSGAIGSIATQEWKILADQIAVIDLTKGEKSINEQIDRVEEQAIATANRMRDGFERQYGEHIDNLAPQYKEIPNVKYKMGSSGFNISGQQTPSGSGNVDSNNKFLK
jgi:hypothetical protein